MTSSTNNGADARLEAEIEIARLRVALKPFTDDDAIELATFLIEEDSERFPKSHNPQNVHFCDEFGNSGLNAVDFLNAKEALTPSDPSPIMALVRAAVRLCKDDNLSRDTMRHLQAFGLYKAVEALPDWVRSL